MIMPPLQVVQIVRNWGPVGGMETYVWQLSQELAKQNCHVTVICEKSHNKHDLQNINVIEIGPLKQKPRWLLYWRFANLVEERLQTLIKKNQVIIHSHERSISHDLTTFHSMPFATIKDKGWWKLFSIRVWAYLKMERRELGGNSDQRVKIIPVSNVITEAIKKYYPDLEKNICPSITPGVTPMPARKDHLTPLQGGTIGFIGKEWRRKGFEFFIKIAEKLVRSRPELKILVLGPQKSEVESLCVNYPGEINFQGWKPSANFYQDLDLLIHPASSEAYGMIIAEAMSCKVPVLVSDSCGAANDVSNDHGTVLSLKSPLEQWVQASTFWLENTSNIKAYERTWAKVAKEYIDEYMMIHKSKYKNQ